MTEGKMRKSIVSLMGTHVYYESYTCTRRSEGTLVMIHGFVSSSFSFRSIIPFLITRYDVISLDLPGFGQSGKTKSFCYSFDNYADLITEFIHLHELNSVSLVGHSMGGQVALYTAKKKPDLVDRIILLSSSGYMQRVKRSFMYATYIPFARQAIRWWIQKKDYRKAILQAVYNKKLIKPVAVEEYSRPLQEKAFYDALICLIRQREGDLKGEELKKISQPCLILWGEEDQIIPVRIGKRLARDLPNATFYSYKKTGHLLPEERPKEVAEKIKHFLGETF
ncbi:alpha/beta fold hydrolase [Bacillus solitudinis]|uniref:alpha/beta fold hydrolase n=1 Tax=Bacillus solitudinis TaxID=2014074 RepID=UPI001D0D3C2D|nr:alpha/beta hydrolase [Bacillus solitudinis]